MGQRRGLGRAGDRAGRRVRGSLGDRPGALVGELRAGRSRRLAGRRGPRARDPGAVAERSSATSPPRRSRRPGSPPHRTGPADVLIGARAARADGAGEGVDDPAFLPWHHLKAHALVDVGELDAAERVHRRGGGARGRAREPAAGARAGSRTRQAASSPATTPSGRGRASRRRGRCVEPLGDAVRAGADRAHAGPGAPAGRRTARRRGDARSRPTAVRASSGAQPGAEALREGARRVRPRAVAAQDARLHAR